MGFPDVGLTDYRRRIGIDVDRIPPFGVDRAAIDPVDPWPGEQGDDLLDRAGRIPAIVIGKADNVPGAGSQAEVARDGEAGAAAQVLERKAPDILRHDRVQRVALVLVDEDDLEVAGALIRQALEQPVKHVVPAQRADDQRKKRPAVFPRICWRAQSPAPIDSSPRPKLYTPADLIAVKRCRPRHALSDQTRGGRSVSAMARPRRLLPGEGR